MKICPTCQTRYDEDILRFCIKDGTPLVEENQPNFTELPSESVNDDLSEETVIRRNTSKTAAQPILPETESSSRIVIPTMPKKTEQQQQQQQVRTKTTASYRQPPQKSNTGKIVLLTVLGTLIVLMGSGIVYLFLSRENANDSNQNKIINANFNSIDTNLNANLTAGGGNLSSNFDFNADTNINTNINTNTNANSNVKNSVKTPTPPPKTPTPTPTPNVNANVNANNSNLAMPTPSSVGGTRPNVTPTPHATPKPSPSPFPANLPVNVGLLNGRAVNLPKPAYPPLAKQMRASGQVAVQVSLDENGTVVSAKATNGNPLLRAPAEAAARQSKFNPIVVGDRAVKVTGILVYNFINQ